ncbi:MAG TPA: hypothetical protein VH740_11655 [Vicinamibacterales bacterium]
MKSSSDAFANVKAIALALPDVESGTKYDGSPVLRVGGAFMAGLAKDGSAEPHTLVVRIGLDERHALLEDAPEVYYLTEYYQPHPVVLVRLSKIDHDALRDLLAVARRRTLPKARRGRLTSCAH